VNAKCVHFDAGVHFENTDIDFDPFFTFIAYFLNFKIVRVSSVVGRDFSALPIRICMSS